MMTEAMSVIILNGSCLLGLFSKHTDSISPSSTEKSSALNLASLSWVPGGEVRIYWTPYLIQLLLNTGLEQVDRFSAWLAVSVVNILFEIPYLKQ